MAAHDKYYGTAADKDYLTRYAYVSGLIETSGCYSSGYSHWTQSGKTEGKTYNMYLNYLPYILGGAGLIGVYFLFFKKHRR